MRDADLCQPHHNRAVIAITPAYYDRRALDTRADYALFTSLTHLGPLVQTSPKVRESLASDGGLERLVRILQEGKLKRKPEQWQARKWQQALLTTVYIAGRGSEHVRRRLVEAAIVPVLVTVLCHALEDLASHADAFRSAMKKLQQRQASCAASQARRVELPVVQPMAQRPQQQQHHEQEQEQSLERVERPQSALPAAVAPVPRPIERLSRSRTVNTDTILPGYRHPAQLQAATAASSSSPTSRANSLPRPTTGERRNSASGRILQDAGETTEPTVRGPDLRGRAAGPALSEADFAFGRRLRRNASTASNASTTSNAGDSRASQTLPSALPDVHRHNNPRSVANSIFDSRLQPMDDMTAARELQRRDTAQTSPRPSRLSSIYRNPTASGSEDAVNDAETSRPGSGAASPLPVQRLRNDDDTSLAVLAQAITLTGTPAVVTAEDTADAVPVLPQINNVNMGQGATDTFGLVPNASPAPLPVVPMRRLSPAPAPFPLGAADALPTATANENIGNSAQQQLRDMAHRQPASYDVDVVWCLRILTYLTKYPALRNHFTATHDVPSLRRNLKQFEFFGKQEASSLNSPALQHRYDQMDEDLSDSLRLPYNLFSIVEKFTMPINTQEATYWAAVVMRNTCRKDLDRGGIRQCAHLDCGKWETKDKQFAKCRRCRRAKYCSKQCQSKAWTGHKWWCEISSKDQQEMHDLYQPSGEQERLIQGPQLFDAQA